MPGPRAPHLQYKGIMRASLSPWIAVSALALACGGPAEPPTKAPSALPGVPDAAVDANPDTSAPPPAARAGRAEDDAAVQRLGDELLELVVRYDPEEASSLGRHDHDDLLTDRSVAGIEARNDAFARLLAKVERASTNLEPTPAGRTDLELLRARIRLELLWDAAMRPATRQPDFYTSAMSAIFDMTAREYAPKEERARKALARIDKIPAMVDEGIKNLRSSENDKAEPAARPPRVWVEIGIARARSAKVFFAEQRPFLEDALPQEKAATGRTLARATAAYAHFADVLEKKVLPLATGDFAVGKKPFEELLKANYGLSRSTDDLVALGKRVFDDTEVKLAEGAKKVDPASKSWPEVVAVLKRKHPTAQALVPAYRTEVARARKFLVEKDVVTFPPGDELTVMETPVFLRSTLTAAYDQPPPFDKNTRGIFFVTPVDASLPKDKQEEMLRENDFGDIVDTAVHEAYPGHHLQLSLARRHPSTIRLLAHASIFSEGWALYSEELMSELGYYTPEERMLQLEWALVRAARILIDVGLHTRTMSFDEAVKLLTDRVHLERTLALSEVRRYSESPTQPLSYMVGREMLFELRTRYAAREGARYTLKRFHDEVLSHGTISPALVAQEMLGEAL